MGRRTISTARFRFLGGELTLQYPGLSEMELLASKWRRNAQNMRPVMQRFKPIVEDQIEASFRGERGSVRWPRLSPAYAEWKQRHFPGKKKLVLTGRYKKGFRVAAFNTQLRVTNNVTVSGHKLLDLHQFGTHKMPARPVLFMTQADRRRMARMIREHINA